MRKREKDKISTMPRGKAINLKKCFLLLCLITATLTMIISTTPKSPWPFRDYSPVTLGYDWSKNWRLISLLLCTIHGSIMNGYFMTSFFVEPRLKNAGNSFLFCTGIADLLVTAGIAPTIILVLVSGDGDNIYVCRILQFVGLSSTYGYTLFHLFAAIENYYRFSRPRPPYSRFAVNSIINMCILIGLVSMILGYCGSVGGLDYDYCERKHHGNLTFRATTTFLLQLLPLLVIMYLMCQIRKLICKRALVDIKYRRTKDFDRDFEMVHMNFVAYLTHVTFWIPYLIVVAEFPDTSNDMFYSSVAVGLVRSVITSSMYGMFHQLFNGAYTNMILYCCLKREMKTKVVRRHRRQIQNQLSSVKIHVTHCHRNMNRSDGPITAL